MGRAFNQASVTATGGWSDRRPRSSTSRRPAAGRPSLNRWSTWLPPRCTSPGSSGGRERLTSPPKTSGAPAAQRMRVPGRRERVGQRELLRVVLRVDVDGPAVREADAVHPARLGPAAEPLGAVLEDLAAHEDRVRPAAVGLQDVRVALGDPAPHRQQPVARGELRALLRAGRPGQRRRPPRRHLLEQRHVPLPAGEGGRELVQQVAAGRRHRPPVIEVPGQDPHGHRP